MALLQSMENNCLTNLLLHIIIISNSNEADISDIKGTYSAVDVLINNENKGFAAACNKAVSLCSSEYVLLLNPDTILEATTLQEAVLFLQNHPNITVLGVTHNNTKGEVVPACFYFPSLKTYLYDITGLSKMAPATYKGLLFPASVNKSGFVHHTSGAFMMIRKAFTNQFGFMDERYFMYAEDMDWCKKVWQNGGSVWYHSNIAIIHEGGNSSQKKENSRRICYALESKLMYAHKHFNSKKYFILLAATIGIEPFTRLAFSLFTFRLEEVKSVFSTYFLFFTRQRWK